MAQGFLNLVKSLPPGIRNRISCDAQSYDALRFHDILFGNYNPNPLDAIDATILKKFSSSKMVVEIAQYLSPGADIHELFPIHRKELAIALLLPLQSVWEKINVRGNKVVQFTKDVIYYGKYYRELDIDIDIYKAYICSKQHMKDHMALILETCLATPNFIDYMKKWSSSDIDDIRIREEFNKFIPTIDNSNVDKLVLDNINSYCSPISKIFIDKDVRPLLAGLDSVFKAACNVAAATHEDVPPQAKKPKLKCDKLLLKFGKKSDRVYTVGNLTIPSCILRYNGHKMVMGIIDSCGEDFPVVADPATGVVSYMYTGEPHFKEFGPNMLKVVDIMLEGDMSSLPQRLSAITRTCVYCGRMLSVGKSIDRAVGPECLKKYGPAFECALNRSTKDIVVSDVKIDNEKDIFSRLTVRSSDLADALSEMDPENYMNRIVELCGCPSIEATRQAFMDIERVNHTRGQWLPIFSFDDPMERMLNAFRVLEHFDGDAPFMQWLKKMLKSMDMMNAIAKLLLD